MKKTSKKLVTVVATVAAVAAMSVTSFAMQSEDFWKAYSSFDAATIANAIHEENVAIGDDNAYVDGLELLKDHSKAPVAAPVVIYTNAQTAVGALSARTLTSAEKAAIANAAHEVNVANGIDNSYVQK
jgi:hypothetical protein